MSRRARHALLHAVTVAALLTGCGAPAATAPPSAVDQRTVTAAAVAAPAPTAVRIPAIGAASTLIRTGLRPDGTVDVPPVRQPEQASWFTESPPPGQHGPAVLLGHVDGGGRDGVFARLHELRAGDVVDVDRAGAAPVRFVVYAVEQVAKSEFPTARVYGDVDRPELRLITCGGAYDPGARSYLGQVIVYAHAQP